MKYESISCDSFWEEACQTSNLELSVDLHLGGRVEGDIFEAIFLKTQLKILNYTSQGVDLSHELFVKEIWIDFI